MHHRLIPQHEAQIDVSEIWEQIVIPFQLRLKLAQCAVWLQYLVQPTEFDMGDVQRDQRVWETIK